MLVAPILHAGHLLPEFAALRTRGDPSNLLSSFGATQPVVIPPAAAAGKPLPSALAKSVYTDCRVLSGCDNTIVHILQQMAERQIQEARDRGELSNLAGEGKPLVLDDDSAVDPELRAGYRLLKNAGFLPAELAQLKQIRDTEALLSEMEPGDEHRHINRKLRVLRARLTCRGRQVLQLLEAGRYREP